MSDLAATLSELQDRMVVDRTNLTGDYAFKLKWMPSDRQNADTEIPGLFTALQEQLGLKLISTRAAIEVIVVDHIEMPSAN